MSENISDGPTMSDITTSNHNVEKNLSPNKSWVQFDDSDRKSEGDSQKSAGGTPIRNAASSSQTSGVSSARGSVNSLSHQNHTINNVLSSPEGAEISVSEIQVNEE